VKEMEKDKKRKFHARNQDELKSAVWWTRIATKAGKRYAIDHPLPEGAEPKKYLNELWCSFYFSKEGNKIPFKQQYVATANAFLEGYCTHLGIEKPDCVLLPTNKTVAAVITALNEEETIPHVLKQLRRMPLHEIIIVVNGSNDNSFNLARECPISTIIHYTNSLGHDVGRSIGAKISDSEMLLFLDADIPIKAEQLLPFIRAIEKGADVALNNITPYIGRFSNRDGVTIIKEFLNRVLGRPDLEANSLTAIPHILSRKSIKKIGFQNLTVPPKAHALAIKKGLQICAPASVNVLSSNKNNIQNTGLVNPVSNLIVGDHLEAMHTLMETQSARLGFRDNNRKRSLFTEGSR
jgi:hypothetical protein